MKYSEELITLAENLHHWFGSTYCPPSTPGIQAIIESYPKDTYDKPPRMPLIALEWFKSAGYLHSDFKTRYSDRSKLS